MSSIHQLFVAGLFAALSLGTASAADPPNAAAAGTHSARAAPLLDLGAPKAQGQRAIDLLAHRLGGGLVRQVAGGSARCCATTGCCASTVAAACSSRKS